MPPERRYGMDHDHYEWSPWIKRKPLKWPGGARVAFSVIVNLERMDWSPPAGSYQPPNYYFHLVTRRSFPEIWTVSHREYGHRIGIFRVLDVLAKHGIPPTIAIDAETATHYPYLVRHCRERGCEFIAHGISGSRMITSRMSEEDERRYIRDSIAAIGAATESAPRGWHGPEYGESALTPKLLAEAGIRYVCDWANDEQPYRMRTPTGELYALPVMVELDDVFALRDRRFPMDGYALQIKEGFDTMYRDAAASARLFVLNLHPWLVGQPFRIRFLDEALAHIARRKRVWKAKGSDVVEAYRKVGV